MSWVEESQAGFPTTFGRYYGAVGRAERNRLGEKAL